MVQDLRVWLELEIPLIEDGNSFGEFSSIPFRYCISSVGIEMGLIMMKFFKLISIIGAEVQNHLINQLETAYKKSNGFINSCRQHHSDRMRFMAGWIKNPNVMVSPKRS